MQQVLDKKICNRCWRSEETETDGSRTEFLDMVEKTAPGVEISQWTRGEASGILEVPGMAVRLRKAHAPGSLPGVYFKKGGEKDSMAEDFEGKITAFIPDSYSIEVDERRFKLHPHLYNQIAKRYRLGDLVTVTHENDVAKAIIKKESER